MQVKALESWYLEHHRKLPFRKTKNPYFIWVSEIMLQQTQVDTVIPYYLNFIQTYPNVQALASADPDQLKKDVEGLGYYRRFSLMQKAAQTIVNEYHGIFPNTYDDVLKLSGVGAYTAGAIMSIAYNQPYSAVDGNVIRVISRYLGLTDDFRQEKNKKKINEINQTWIEQATPHLYTQALMELGSEVCTPKKPMCEACPIQSGCVAYQKQLVDTIPFLTKLKKQKEIQYITLLIEKEDKRFLRKRSESLLQGMYEYPQFESESIHDVIDTLDSQGIRLNILEDLGFKKHVFSHQIWHMHIYKVLLLNDPDPSWMGYTNDQILKLPMAIAHRKI